MVPQCSALITFQSIFYLHEIRFSKKELFNKKEPLKKELFAYCRSTKGSCLGPVEGSKDTL